MWKSSCVRGDRAKVSSLETRLAMWRSLEPHISARASWQVEIFTFHESSQEQWGGAAGGKVTQVWGWGGEEGQVGGPWDERSRRLPKQEVGSVTRLSPPQQVLAGLPADLCTETSPAALGNKLLLESQGQSS